MPLYLIGLGLCDEKDISVRGLELVKSADEVYLESYTSILFCDKSRLEAFYQKKVTTMDRENVEQGCDAMLDAAMTKIVAFLVVGDPLCATTHSDLMLRARTKNIDVHVIHNASAMTAVAACGLQLYCFGETVSIPFFTDTWQPDSFYDKIKKNQTLGLHTLCLLDIKVKEQTPENMMRNNSIYEPPRYMTVPQAINQLLLIENKRREGVCGPQVKAFGIARLGNLTSQCIVAGTLEQLKDHDLGEPLHSLVICGPALHEMEDAFYTMYQIKPQQLN